MTGAGRAQQLATGAAFVCGFLGLTASSGCPVFPPGDPSAAGWLHIVLIVAGGLGGWLAVRRSGEIDAERWQIVEEDGLTSGEREYAHKEAEQRKRVAAIVFLVAPLTAGFWAAYQFRGRVGSLADFLTVAPLLGFGIGLGMALWLRRGKGDPA